MTSPETIILRQRLARVITRRAVLSNGETDVAAAARLTHNDLTSVFAPLISSAGVEALWGRAFDLAQREYPANQGEGGNSTMDQSFAQANVWLHKQTPSVALEAAAAMFAAFAELLTTLIGEPLTTRYLDKAWPDESSDALPKGKKA